VSALPVSAPSSFPIPADELLVAVLARPLTFASTVLPAGSLVGVRASGLEAARARRSPWVLAYGGRSGLLSAVVPISALLVP
jgi:hypothetical protein